MKYRARDISTDDETTLEARDLKHAKELAQDWLAQGTWGDLEEYVEVAMIDEAEEERVVDVVVGGKPEPKCRRKRHAWGSPYEVVGGLRENPGVWSICGPQLQILEVCKHCGRYRETVTKSAPGQCPCTPERVSYRDPDQASLDWAGLSE